MREKILPFWHLIIGIIGLVVVVGAIVFWLNNELDKNSTLKKEIERLSSIEPEIVEVTKEVVVEKEVYIEIEKDCTQKLEEKYENIDKKVVEEVVLRLPKPFLKLECKGMELGKWDLPKSCETDIKKKLAGVVDKEKHFVVITAIVDSRRYPEPNVELKQAGLAQFRAEVASKLVKEIAPKGVMILLKKPIKTDTVRGFNIEIYSY